MKFIIPILVLISTLNLYAQDTTYNKFKATLDSYSNSIDPESVDFFDTKWLESLEIPDEYKRLYLDGANRQLDFQSKFDSLIANFEELGFPRELKVLYDPVTESIVYMEELEAKSISARNEEIKSWLSVCESSCYSSGFLIVKSGIYRITSYEYWEGFLDFYGEILVLNTVEINEDEAIEEVVILGIDNNGLEIINIDEEEEINKPKAVSNQLLELAQKVQKLKLSNGKKEGEEGFLSASQVQQLSMEVSLELMSRNMTFLDLEEKMEQIRLVDVNQPLESGLNENDSEVTNEPMIIDLYDTFEEKMLTTYVPPLMYKDLEETNSMVVNFLEGSEILASYTMNYNSLEFRIYLISGVLRLGWNESKIVVMSPYDLFTPIFEESFYVDNQMVNWVDEGVAFFKRLPDAPQTNLYDSYLYVLEQINQTDRKIRYHHSTGNTFSFFTHSGQISDDTVCIYTVMDTSLSSLVEQCNSFFNMAGIWKERTGQIIQSSNMTTKYISEDLVKERLREYINKHPKMHGIFGDDFMEGLYHSPSSGVYSYYITVCIGDNEYVCDNESLYMNSEDEGINWTVDFGQ